MELHCGCTGDSMNWFTLRFTNNIINKYYLSWIHNRTGYYMKYVQLLLLIPLACIIILGTLGLIFQVKYSMTVIVVGFLQAISVLWEIALNKCTRKIRIIHGVMPNFIFISSIFYVQIHVDDHIYLTYNTIISVVYIIYYTTKGAFSWRVGLASNLLLFLVAAIIYVQNTNDRISSPIGNILGFYMIYAILFALIGYQWEKEQRHQFYHYYTENVNFNQFKQVLANLLTGVLICNTKAQFVFANNSMYKSLGLMERRKHSSTIELLDPDIKRELNIFTTNDEKHQTLTEILNEKLIGELQINNMESISYSSDKESAVFLQRIIKNGVEMDKWFEINFIGIELANKAYLMIQVKDQTDYNALQKEIMQRKYEELLSTYLSHELRTPLHVMISMFELLRIKIDDPELKKSINHGYISAQMLEGLIQGSVDVSNSKYQIININETEFPLAEILEECREIVHPQLHENVEFQIKVDGDIPDIIISDKSRLRLILMILLMNAVKYTYHGSITLIVKLGSISPNISRNDFHLVFKVKDTGIGIQENILPNLFSLYANHNKFDDNLYNSSSMIQQKSHGTGLGLTIAKLEVEALGGAIKAKSNIELGTCFQFSILNIPNNVRKESQQSKSLAGTEWNIPYEATPLSSRSLYYAPLTEKFLQSAIPSPESLPIALEEVEMDIVTRSIPSNPYFGQTVLIVDDQSFNLFAVGQLLQLLQIPYLIASNGEECISRIMENENERGSKRIGLIFMDVNMPILDGISTTIILREKMGNEEIQSIPIYGLTAYTTDSTIQSCYLAGMDKVLTKPLALPILKQSLLSANQ